MQRFRNDGSCDDDRSGADERALRQLAAIAAKRPISIGISACLLGQPVRYDGRHKRHPWLVAELGRHVTWLAVCPEVELGLGVPRPPIELVRMAGGEIRLRAVDSGRDLTVAMGRHAAARVAELAAAQLSGYVFKARSPSCGVTGVAVRTVSAGRSGMPSIRDDGQPGTGLFAAELVARCPELPVAQDSELDSPDARARFVERVCRYHARSTH
ncbi:MAG: DUF523 domain-containing protein [Myxococcota bacterium]